MPLGYDLLILKTLADESLKSAYGRIVDFEQNLAAEEPSEGYRIGADEVANELSSALMLKPTVRDIGAVAKEKAITEEQARVRFAGYLLDTPNDSTFCYQILLSPWCGRVRYLQWGLSEEDRVALVEGWGKIVAVCQRHGLRIYDPVYDREAGAAYSGQIVQGIDSQLKTVETKYGKTDPMGRP